MTKEQEALQHRVLGLLEHVKFDLAGHPYRFVYDPNRQLVHGVHHIGGGGNVWHTRKWYVSEHATNSEILQTILKLCLTSAEHEARESFTYRGKAVYGPHMDADRLLHIADDTVHRDDPVPSNMPAPVVRHSPMPA